MHKDKEKKDRGGEDERVREEKSAEIKWVSGALQAGAFREKEGSGDQNQSRIRNTLHTVNSNRRPREHRCAQGRTQKGTDTHIGDTHEIMHIMFFFQT